MLGTDSSIKHIRRPITPPSQRRCKQLFLVIFLLIPQIMATELDVSKSRRFDIAMSRRTRRSTSLVTCFQDQYVPPLTQHQHRDAKLKTLFQCQDAELQAFNQFEDAEQQIRCLPEGEGPKIQQAPMQDEADEDKRLEQYEDEEEKEPLWYHHEQKKPEQFLDDETTPKRFQYEDAWTSKYQDEEQITPKEYEYDGETMPKQHQDEEHKSPQQCQADKNESEQHEEGEEQKAQQESCDAEQKTPEECRSVKNLPPPPGALDGVARFSLQELIQEKQLPVREAKITSKAGGRGENVLADHKVSGSGGATGGTTLAMVIRRPDGGKKSMGMIRRCVKALNQMIKAKHGSKKSTTL